jgi:hypothetical protein
VAVTSDRTVGGGTALSQANRAALAHVRARAERERPRLMARIAQVLGDAGVDTDAEALADAAGRGADVTLSFHPDRLLADGRSVAEALCDEGVYRSQFETRISNGGLTAYPGGDRDRWERALFGGAYQAPGVRHAERPRYGGLNLLHHRNGACPAFGSCHLRLRRQETSRATFIFGDSVAEPADVGLVDAFASVLAPLVESLASGAGLLGRPGVDVAAFVRGVLRGDHVQARGAFAPAVAQSLNDYIEAQVHGEIRLAAHVDAVVVDAAFRDTPAGERLAAAARRHGPRLEWHPGLILPLEDVPHDVPAAPGAELYRWQAFCAGGRAHRFAGHVVAERGAGPCLDAANIGAAAASVVREPERWRDWGAPDEVLVRLKDLWRLLVAHGEPRAG